MQVKALNPSQTAVSLSRAPRTLALAGAGTGKTEACVRWAANLVLEGVPRSQILMLTFTKKAAAAMKARVNALVADIPNPDGGSITVGNYHNIASRLLRGDPVGFGLGSSNFTILDDDDTVRSVAQTMLERSGFTVLTARDGSEGLAMFEAGRDRIALVLLDLTMPTLGGEETFRAMLRLRSEVRVVLMSGYSRQELAARYGAEGLAGFIQKPFRLEELEACLTTVLDGGPPI